MANGKSLIAKERPSWKKSFSQGIVNAHKMGYCTDCKKDILCESCANLVNQKQFSANLKELKREKPNDLGHMLPKYIIT